MGEPIFVETWEVADCTDGNILDISYTKSMCPTPEMAEKFRNSTAEAHKCKLKRLLGTRKIEFQIKKR